MKHKLYALLLCLFTALALTGCQLAQPNADGDMEEDRLVGIFLTQEYLDLFNLEGYMNDNLMNLQGDTVIIDGYAPDYQGRLYAEQTIKTLTNEATGKQTEIADFVFPVDGIPYFSALISQEDTGDSYNMSVSDPAVSDGHVHYKIEDSGDSVTMTGTLYVPPSNITKTYYFNPVYQSADGRIYAVSGSSFMFSTESYSEGSVYSQTMDETSTVTENGMTTTKSASVTLSIHCMYAPETIIVLQMDAESGVLSRAEYTPDTMPKTITADPLTDYILVETHKRDAQNKLLTSRIIYGRGADSIETFFLREDGFLVSQSTPIVWPKTP